MTKVIIRNSPATLNQEIVMGYINCPTTTNFSHAVACLETEKQEQGGVPEWLWQKLAITASKRGDPTALRQCFYYFGDEQPPQGMYLRCAHNAMKHLQVAATIEAYREAGMPLPTAPFKSMLDKLLEQFIEGSKIVDLAEVLARYKDKLNDTPSTRMFTKLIDIAKKEYLIRWYVELCDLSGISKDPKFIQQCHEYWVKKFDYQNIQYTSNLVGQPLDKKFLLKIGKNAFAAGNVNEGKKFIELAYTM